MMGTKLEISGPPVKGTNMHLTTVARVWIGAEGSASPASKDPLPEGVMGADEILDLHLEGVVKVHSDGRVERLRATSEDDLIRALSNAVIYVNEHHTPAVDWSRHSPHEIYEILMNMPRVASNWASDLCDPDNEDSGKIYCRGDIRNYENLEEVWKVRGGIGWRREFIPDLYESLDAAKAAVDASLKAGGWLLMDYADFQKEK